MDGIVWPASWRAGGLVFLILCAGDKLGCRRSGAIYTIGKAELFGWMGGWGVS